MAGQRSGALIFIFITVLIDVIGLGIIIPVFPDLIKDLIQSDISEASKYAGWLTFAFAFMQFLFAPFMGGLSDRFGRRPVLLIALFGLGIDYLIHALAPTIWVLLAGRILAGMAGASFTTANAYIADISPPEKRSQNFGLVGAAFGLGFIIGPAIGGLFSEFGTRVPFLIAAGLSMLNVIYGFFILPESLDSSKRRPFSIQRANPFGSLREIMKFPVITGLVLSFLLIHTASHALQSTWTFYTIFKFNWDAKLVGISLSVVGFLVAIVQGGLIRLIIPWIGQRRTAIMGMILWIVGMLLFASATEGWMMYVFLVPYALGGIAGPSLQGIASNQVQENQQGELQGALTSLMSLAAIIGPLLMTQLFNRFTNGDLGFILPGIPFLAGAVLILAALALALPSLRKYDEPNPG